MDLRRLGGPEFIGHENVPVMALMMVIPKMFALFLLLLVLFFIFSILFTDLFKDAFEDEITSEDYFSSLSVTLFTLFQIMTLDG